MALRSRALVVAVAATTALVGVGAVPGAIPPAGAAQVVQTFAYTGGTQTFTVPAGVTELTVEVYGGAGGNGEAYATNPDCATDYGRGALGGASTATLAVTPGETLQINVGGKGADVPQFSSELPAGGFNGGGDGGSGDSNGYGGGGGGASDIRRGSALDDRLVVAGGGGGGGACVGAAGADGGVGGGVTGGDGANAPDCDGGAGGTATDGGDGGFGCGSGGDGSLGQGGVGAESGAAGGGGGGGLYGGGGGSGGAGGGGGSGFGPSTAALRSGVQSGNGAIVLTYEGGESTSSTSSTTAGVQQTTQPKFTG